MNKTRQVTQRRACTCNNWCKNNQLTPYPLSSKNTPDENIISEGCEEGRCQFLVWKETD